MSKSLHILTSVIFVASVCSCNAEGKGSFLASAHDHSKMTTHYVEVGEAGAQFLNVKREDLEEVDAHNEPPGKLAKQYGGPEDVAVEVKYPFIYGAHKRLAAVFSKYTEHWYMDWKLWLGATIWFAVWSRWLTSGYEEVFWVQALFAFGINIVILHHLQYALTTKLAMLVVCTLLCLQALFQSYMWSKSELSSDDGSGIGALPLGKDTEEFECETMYLDLALPIEQVCVLFIAQVCVSWFYMTYILANFDMEHVNYSFWLVAYLTMQMTMIFCRGADSALGKAFPTHDVYALWVSSERISLALKGANSQPFKISRFNIFLRGATGFFCNAVLREILAYTIPLMLMSFTEPMDFVVYCVGVNFICTIDDTKDRTYIVRHHHVEEDSQIQDKK